mgnify:CR=1 FL=1
MPEHAKSAIKLALLVKVQGQRNAFLAKQIMCLPDQVLIHAAHREISIMAHLIKPAIPIVKIALGLFQTSAPSVHRTNSKVRLHLLSVASKPAHQITT